MDSCNRTAGRARRTAVDQLTAAPQLVNAEETQQAVPSSRLRKLQGLGILCGFSAGAWLGAAEAPTKLVRIGVSPIVVSLLMVVGVFLARWSVPALFRSMGQVRTDIQQAPHLIVWGVLGGCLWAVANTLTIFAIRDVGLSIAFPLWNMNSLIGIFWGFVLFNELRQAGRLRWLSVIGGTLLMLLGAALLAFASSTQAPVEHVVRGTLAALAAGMLWGTMYIPYRKAYLTGMNPLSFIVFFTIGELGMMTILAFSYRGPSALLHELIKAKDVLFWLAFGGFVWVIGDLFQQYAAKYIGISRGIPLSNTNQLWGLMWGVLVFGELHGMSRSVYGQVIGGSVLMLAGAGAIALSSVTREEHGRWHQAAQREGQRYSVDSDYVRAGLAGENFSEARDRQSMRSWFDWILVLLATAVFVCLAVVARVPAITLNWAAMAALSATMFAFLAVCGVALWKVTRFS